MVIEIRKTATETVIELAGRLDTSTAPALEKAIAENVAESANLLLDMKALEYISSAGLRVLLGAQKRMQKQGSMKLKQVAPEVMEVLEMTGFADILKVE